MTASTYTARQGLEFMLGDMRLAICATRTANRMMLGENGGGYCSVDNRITKNLSFSLTLYHGIENRAKVSAGENTEKFTLERLLFDQVKQWLDEALIDPSDTLPDYRNPGVYLLGVLRQFNTR